MKKSDIKAGQIYQEIKPSKHTSKLHKLEVLSVKQHYEHGKKSDNWKSQRNYTYIYYKTCEGSYYPAANSTERNLLLLDGLVGNILLSNFKREYKILES